MINIENITKSFGKFIALDKVSLILKETDCVALIGPNGSGKTTLIKSILGMVVPTSGNILFDNKSIFNDCDYRKNIGYMPQIGRYPENMTIGQIIEMIIDIRKPQKSELDNELIESFGLNKILSKRMSTLSGGTRQKVSASLVFLFDAKVLILDEPTAGLDPISSEILKEKILKEKNKGKLIIITSHVLSDLEDIISEVVYMQDGQLKLHQSIDNLLFSTGQNRLAKAITQLIYQSNI